MSFVQIKKGWLPIGQEGFAWVGGTVCLKYLKRVGTEKRGEGTKILKRGRGQAGSRGGSVSIQVTPFFMVGICAA